MATVTSTPDAPELRAPHSNARDSGDDHHDDDADDNHGAEAVEGTHDAWYDLGKFGATGERAAARLDKARRDLVEFTTKHPVAAVGAAAALGFFIARIFRR